MVISALLGHEGWLMGLGMGDGGVVVGGLMTGLDRQTVMRPTGWLLGWR